MNALNRAIEILGSQAAVAAAVGSGQSRVGNWVSRGTLPDQAACAAIEAATGGACLCEDLNPDLHWLRLPDPEYPHHKGGRPVIDPTKADREAA